MSDADASPPRDNEAYEEEEYVDDNTQDEVHAAQDTTPHDINNADQTSHEDTAQNAATAQPQNDSTKVGGSEANNPVEGPHNTVEEPESHSSPEAAAPSQSESSNKGSTAPPLQPAGPPQQDNKVDSHGKSSPRAAGKEQQHSSPVRGGPRMTAATEKDTELKLLYLPPNERPAVVDEHGRHRERMEAITMGRSISQSTTLSRATQGSTISRKSSPRNKVDPLTQQIMENHKKALDRVMQPGPQRLPLVHITHYKRLGNTHGHKQEFVNPSAPHEPLISRERRLQNNNYRSGRLNAAERVDEDNAKFVTALIHVKPVVTSTMCLLEQERERQSWMRQIERGPNKNSPRGTPAASVVAVESVREAQWDNRISNVIPRPPVITSATMEHSARPKVIWDDKLTQAREIERRKLASLQQQNDDAPPAENQQAATSPVAASGKTAHSTKSRRPKPPPSTLVDCMGKVPPVNSGRHSGHSATTAHDGSSAPEHQSHERLRKDAQSNEAEPAPETTDKPHDEHYSDDEEMVPHEDAEEATSAGGAADSTAHFSTSTAPNAEPSSENEQPPPHHVNGEASDETPIEQSELEEL
jgi:hypothetical protein